MSWSSHPRRVAFGVGIAIVLAGVILAGLGMLSPPAPVQAAQTDSQALGMFGEMMPVFTSPRCLNCHGGVDAVKGTNHEVGPIDVPVEPNGDMNTDDKSRAACQECHTAGNDQWRTAPSAFSFVGKDVLTLCRQMRGSAAGGSFVNHIATDDLIGLAFVGQRGIGEDSAFAPIAPNPPPMDRAEMVAAAKHWVEDGQAGCGSTWNGTIDKTTTSKTHQESAVTKVILDSGSEVKAKIMIVDGQAKGTIHVDKHQFSDPTPTGGCNFQHHTQVADGSGPVEVQVIGEADANGLFVTFYSPEAVGTNHHDIGTGPSPGCKPVKMAVVPDEKYTLQKDFSALEIKIDPNDPPDPNNPNHVFGFKVVEELDGSSSTYVWDLAKN